MVQVSITWDKDEFDAIIQRCRDVMETAMDLVAGEGINKISEAVNEPNPKTGRRAVDTGILKQPGNWVYERQENFSRRITPLPNSPINVYAGYIWKGTGPAAGHQQYWPNIGAIEALCRRKRITDPDAPFLISRHIYRYGTEPNDFIERAKARLEQMDFTPHVSIAMKKHGVA